MNRMPLPYNVVILWCYCYRITATTVHLNSQEHRQRCFADKNNVFRSADVEQLTHEAVDKIQTSAWNGDVQRMEELQEQGFQIEISLVREMELTTVNLRDSDTEVSKVSDEDDESICIVLINLQAPCVLCIGRVFHYSPENAFYIFNQQIYFII